MYFGIILAVHLFLCALLIGLVLLQQGKGAELGATLSGASNTVFGAAGAVPFIARLTTGVAIAFMVTSLLLVKVYNSGSIIGKESLEDGLTAGSVVVDEGAGGGADGAQTGDVSVGATTATQQGSGGEAPVAPAAESGVAGSVSSAPAVPAPANEGQGVSGGTSGERASQPSAQAQKSTEGATAPDVSSVGEKAASDEAGGAKAGKSK